MAGDKTLHWGDYLVFISSLVFSVAIGVYYAVREGQKTTQEYLMAGRKVHVIPASISLMVSFLSAITLLGDSSENYFYGVTYTLYIVASVFSIFVAAFVFVPLFYPLKLTSVQEYLMMRYRSKAAVYLGYSCNLITNILVCGMLLFGPAIMMHAVSGFPVWATIILVGAASTGYSCIGGFKAVIWTDVFQAVVIFGALLAVSIQGIIAVGGIGDVFKYAYEGGRFHVKMEMSPTNRLDFGTMCFIHVVHRMGMYGMVQTSVQRYCSLPTMRQAQTSIFMVLPMLIVVALLSGFTGIVAFSYYASVGCDPFRAGYINNQNQILPYFVMDVLDVPGIPGLFVAGIVCGSLSSLSSCYSSIAAITWEDVLKDQSFFVKLHESKKTLATKMIVLIFGALSIVMGLLLMNMKGNLITIAFTIIGPLFCILLLLTCLGATFPHINARTAIVGSIAGFVFSIWITVGAMKLGHQFETLPSSTANCTRPDLGIGLYNGTTASMDDVTYSPSDLMSLAINEPIAGNQNVTENHEHALIGIDHLYAMSHMWYMMVGLTGGVLVALLLSIIPGFHEEEEIDPKYLFAFVRPLLNRCKGPSQIYTKAATDIPQEDIFVKDSKA